MRTTIEIDDELREKLIKEAAERGEKGYSTIVNEALRSYLERRDQQDRELKNALALRGSFDDKRINQLKQRIDRAWTRWEL